jgi:hypothetical protein
VSPLHAGDLTGDPGGTHRDERLAIELLPGEGDLEVEGERLVEDRFELKQG